MTDREPESQRDIEDRRYIDKRHDSLAYDDR